VGDLGVVPLTVGGVVAMISAVVGVIKTYRWFLAQIKEVVSDALRSHEDKETVWQTEVTRRLDVIEEKVDRLSEGK
jgi:hypothetical protein